MGVGKRCHHGKEKYYCYDCGGKGACPCHKRKARCKIHGGHLLCKPHGIELYYCKRCKGKGICNHGFQRRHCRLCAAQGKPVLCRHRLVMGLCLKCIAATEPSSRPNVGEHSAAEEHTKKEKTIQPPVAKKQKRSESQHTDVQKILSLPASVLVCLVNVV